MSNKLKRGFTLIEALVITTIVALCLCMAVPIVRKLHLAATTGTAVVNKVVIAKTTAIETSWQPEAGYRVGPHSVYFLIAADGTTARVDVGTYAVVKVGDTYGSMDWQRH